MITQGYVGSVIADKDGNIKTISISSLTRTLIVDGDSIITNTGSELIGSKVQVKLDEINYHVIEMTIVGGRVV